VTGAANSIKVGVVGVGHFGAHHAKHLAVNPVARLVAIADSDRARAERVAALYRAEPFVDHRALIGRVEAAIVAVPTSAHHAVAAELIEAGIHLLVEKPIAADVAAGADLVARAERRGTILQVGHIERYAPAFRALSDRAREPLLIECARRAPWSGRATDVDVVLDLMIHDIDLVLALVEAPVASVEASGVAVVTRRIDVAEARIVFRNGTVATLAASRVAAVGERTIAVMEEGRRLVADLARPSLTVLTNVGGAIAADAVPLASQDKLATEIEAFLASIVRRTSPPVDGRAGLAALKAADMVVSAIARGRRVEAGYGVAAA
jgi:predicted dehydrogenase